MSRKELKEKAKASLKNNWGESIKIILMYLLISFVMGFILGILESFFKIGDSVKDTIESVLSIVITPFFVLGLTNFFVKISKNEKVTYKELFSKTNMFGVVLLTTLLVGIFTFLWSLLLIIPGIIAAINYSQVYYVLLDNPNISAIDAIKKSKEIMNGHKMEYFKLCLSFMGWLLLTALTFGIGMLWLMPYMQVTFANFYNSIKN